MFKFLSKKINFLYKYFYKITFNKKDIKNDKQH